MTHTRDNIAACRGAALRRAVLASGFLALAAVPAAASSARSEGIASFYGRSEHGGPTASGERFNMNAMTAAHRTAPLGSHLRVTNLRNGKSVVVRINDRGPFVKGRIIDLSKAAADVLGFAGAGLTRVAIETTTGDAPATRVADVATAGDGATAPTTRRTAGHTDETAVAMLTDVDRLIIDRSLADGNR